MDQLQAEPDGLAFEEPGSDMLSLCLICGLKGRHSKNITSDHLKCSLNGIGDGDDEEKATGISQQLNVIFLLRKMLQVPSVNLEKYLVEFGNPTNWKISLCEPCSQLTSQAKDLHFQILEISAKLKKIQKQIVDQAKLPNNQLSPGPDGHDDIILSNNMIYKETRQFVKKHNYDDYFRGDPLHEGNQLIKNILEEAATPSTKVKIEVDLPSSEEEPFDDNLDDYNSDDNWAPSPQPIRNRTRRKPRNRLSKSTKEPQPCPHCSLQLPSISSLFQHLRSTHSTNKLSCPHPNCTLSLTSSSQYSTHQKIHRDPLTCHLCPEESTPTFLTNRDRRRHLNQVHDLAKLQTRTRSKKVVDPPKFIPKKCYKCPLIFRRIIDLFRHLQKSHSTNELPCFHDNCTRILTNRNDYFVHERWHTKPLKCDKCEAAFTNLRCFRTHMFTSHQIKLPTTQKPINKSKPIKPPINKSEPIKPPIKKVKKDKVDSGKLSSTCHLCGQMVSRGKLNIHLGRKHGGGVFKCKVSGCEGIYLKKEALDKHMKLMHGGDGGDGEEMITKRFFCSFCGVGFFQRRRLTRHEEIHKNADTKPFVCEFCGKGFATDGTLYDHRRYSHYKIRKIYKPKKKKVEELEEKHEGDGAAGIDLLKVDDHHDEEEK